MTPSYSIYLWDWAPSPDEPYDYPEHWSTRLAAERLGSPSTGLTAREVVTALHKLEALSWDRENSIYIEREQEAMVAA